MVALNAVWDVIPKDENGNAHIGDMLIVDCYKTRTYFSNRLVSLVDVSDIVVIETADAVLVANKSRS